jgi:hypothetical protein
MAAGGPRYCEVWWPRPAEMLIVNNNYNVEAASVGGLIHFRNGHKASAKAALATLLMSKADIVGVSFLARKF